MNYALAGFHVGGYDFGFVDVHCSVFVVDGELGSLNGANFHSVAQIAGHRLSCYDVLGEDALQFLFVFGLYQRLYGSGGQGGEGGVYGSEYGKGSGSAEGFGQFGGYYGGYEGCERAVVDGGFYDVHGVLGY